MVISLIAVVAIILGLAWMTRRMQVMRGATGSELSVRATLAVGLKERVVIIEAAGQQYLIGVAPGQVSLLQALGAAAAQSPGAAPLPSVDGASPANPGLGEAFAIQLNKLLGR
ncbi:MAG: flagellar biosynthesis protein FliO [Panacagrimonas sp.]|jgi:flagellar protein FliO/FliZ|nr:flagellar biosynthesis protein FliO [Panacagrimonas sp.]